MVVDSHIMLVCHKTQSKELSSVAISMTISIFCIFGDVHILEPKCADSWFVLSLHLLHQGQGVPISKVDVAPQASNLDGPTSLKRRRPSKAPPTAPTSLRRRKLTQHSNQLLIAPPRPITIAPVPASSPSLPALCAKLQGISSYLTFLYFLYFCNVVC